MTLLEITDIGGGVVEIIYNDASQTTKSRLLRKSSFGDVQLMKDLSAVTIQGYDLIKISYEQITSINGVSNPADNQVVYDEFKAMMIT